jgi:glycosyltransferase involved in cell wall biosynthesis
VAAAETPEAVATAIETVLQEPAAYETYRRNGWERSKTFQWNVVLPAACEWLERQAQKRI